MKTLIIYNDLGQVVFSNEDPNVKEEQFKPLVVTVPQGKMLIGVNIETNEPIFSDIPKSETQQLREDLEAAVLEMSTLIAMGGM